MTEQLVERAAALNLLGVAGSPYALLATCTVTDIDGNAVSWGSVTGLACAVYVGTATDATAAYAATVTSPSSGKILVSWSAAQATLMRQQNTLRYQLVATISSAGPFALLAGQVAFAREGTPGTTTTVSTLTAVYGGTVTLAVTTGGGSGGGGASTLDGLTDVVITSPLVGHILRHNGTEWVNVLGTTYFQAAGAAAGGVLAGTYPNPSFAADMATQAELDAHNHTGVYQPLDTDLTAIAALVSAADKMPYATGAGTWSLADLSAFARTILDDANAAAVIATLGLAALYQPLDTELTALAGLTSAADKGIQFTGSGTAGTFDLTTFAKTILDDANAAAVIATLGLAALYQPLDATLTALAALATAADKLIYATGSDTFTTTDLTSFARTLLDDANAAAARTTLALGTMATETATDYVAKALFDANTILMAVSDNTPTALTVAASRILGRKASGDIAAMTADELMAVLSGADAGGATLQDMGAVEYRVNTVAATGSTETLDVSLYSVHRCTMDQSCTFTFSNPAPSGELSSFLLILSGAFTPTFPAAVDWGDATPPTYTTPSIYGFYTLDAGTTYYGVSLGKAFG